MADFMADGTGMDTYNTTDLSLAAFLVAKGASLIRIDPAERHHRFIFKADAKNLAARFFLNDSVGARDFASALRNLKTAIHSL